MSAAIITNPYRLKLCSNIHKAPIILIRHIRSVFNEVNRIALNNNDTEFVKSIRFNRSLIDSDILNQAQLEMEKANALKELNIRHIITSPLKRTLITCNESIKKIEQSKLTINPPIVEVHPLLYEKIEDSCDLIRSLEENEKFFSVFNFRDKLFPVDWGKFNSMPYTLYDKRIYQLKNCRKLAIKNMNNANANNSYKTNYLGNSDNSNSFKLIDIDKDYYYNFGIKSLNSKEVNIEDVFGFLLDEMKKLSEINECIEDYESTFERIRELYKYVKGIVSGLDQSKNEKILIVGHSVFLKYWCTELICQETFKPKSETKKLGNCEIVGVEL